MKKYFIKYIIFFLCFIILAVIFLPFNYKEEYNKKEDFVFIMTRHVNSKTTNKYWIESYNCIRKIYPHTKIVIIDDNSNQSFISKDIDLYNVEVVQSEFPGRGELLPYYYFYVNKYAEKAMMIHDSVFIKKKIDFDNLDKDVTILWSNAHDWNDVENETKMIIHLNHSDELLKLYNNKDQWRLAFGVLSIISHDFLTKIQDKYNIFNLLDVIKTRSDRMCLERIFGLICHAEKNDLINKPILFGNQYKPEYTFDDYLKNNDDEPIIKVYSGR